MITLHYQPSAADRCDDKCALPILAARRCGRQWRGPAPPPTGGAPGDLCLRAARARAPRSQCLDAPLPTTWFRLLIERPSRSPRALSLLRQFRPFAVTRWNHRSRPKAVFQFRILYEVGKPVSQCSTTVCNPYPSMETDPGEEVGPGMAIKRG
jgi:hypothetical protein